MDESRLPGHGFEPQPAPEPAPQPDPIPDPDPTEPVAPGAQGAFRGAGSIIVRLAGTEPFSDGGVAIVELLNAGEVVETREFPLGLYPVEMEWTRDLWWPTDEAGDQTRVTLMSGDEVLRTLTDDVADLPVVERACDPKGFVDRCANGLVCLGPTLEMQGACTSVDVVARRLQGDAVIDLRGDAHPRALLTTVTVVGSEGGESRQPQAVAGSAEWRRYVRVPHDGTEAVAVYAGPHRVVADLAVEARPRRAADSGCDVARLIDACVAGTACSDMGVCATIHAPVIERIRAHRDGDVVGFWIAGVDPDRDVRAIQVSWLDAAPEFDAPRDAWFYVSPHQRSVLSVIEYDIDGNFEGFWVHPPVEGMDVAGVEVVLIDSEDQSSEPMQARFEAAEQVPRQVGQTCDVFDALTTCAGAAVCDLVDGADQYRCVEVVPGCAAPEAWPAIEGDRVEGSTATGVDITRGSCMRSRGNLGEDRGFSLTARQAGVHRVTVSSEQYGALTAVTARRQCDLPGPASELGCAGDMGGGNGTGGPLSLDIELMQGETVYLLVEGSWTGGGPFVLAVERP
jgi:hypothetical protein